MFVGNHNFSGSWRGNFVGSVIRISKINIKQMVVHMFEGMEICGQGLPKKATNIGLPQAMIPQLA